MSKLPKFKVGQRVRFKSHEELKRIGIRVTICVDENFIYSDRVFTIAWVTPSGNYGLNNWELLNSRHNYVYHEDFLQPAYELDDKFKGL